MTEMTMGMISAPRAASSKSVFARFFGWVAAEKMRRQTITELNRLNDRELADIGISRCDIYRLAAGESIR